MSTIYEDAYVIARLAENAAVKGHIIIQPRRQARHLGELPPEESAHLFLVANYTAAILFQGLKAEGTNIICNEEEEQLTVHVLARRSDDGLSFQWQPQQIDEATMNEALERIRDALDKPPETPSETPDKRDSREKHDNEDPAEEVASAEAEENYLIKQLIRVP